MRNPKSSGGYSDRMMMEGLKQPISNRAMAQSSNMAMVQETSSCEVKPSRKPYVHFSIEKKVGDAKIYVSGGPEEIDNARDAVNDAVKKLKGKE